MQVIEKIVAKINRKRLEHRWKEYKYLNELGKYRVQDKGDFIRVSRRGLGYSYLDVYPEQQTIKVIKQYKTLHYKSLEELNEVIRKEINEFRERKKKRKPAI